MPARFPRPLAVLLVLALLTPLLAASPPAAAHDHRAPVLAWYYGWWTLGNWQRTSDLPVALYDSADSETMRRQIREARGAGIDGFVCTWQYNCRQLLTLAELEGGFSVTVSVDPGADASLSSFSAVANALREIDALSASPAWARVDGRPLVVFWDSHILPGDSSVAAFGRLRDAVDADRSQFWLGGGTDFSYLDVFDAIQYFDISWEASPGAAMASYANRLANYNAIHGTSRPFVATVMPGYDDLAYRNGHRRDREGGAYYHRTWDDAFRYDAKIVMITSWNEWYEGSQIEPGRAEGTRSLDITRERALQWRMRPQGFADPEFFETWSRTDQAVRDGVAARSWVWGFMRTTGGREHYGDGTRLVQYFDKSRMEINDPHGDRGSSWFVTNGLLVMELVTGQLQLADDRFQLWAPSDAVLAGDPRHLNPDVPGYSALGAHLGRASDRTGATVSTQLLRWGETSEIAPPVSATLAHWIGETGHNVPGVFWDYLHQQGPVWNGAGYVTGPVVDWLFAFGYPVSEPYWVRATVSGTEQWVLVQAFERRVLTWTPGNPPAYQVEMGNVGQHYHQWRYGWSW